MSNDVIFLWHADRTIDIAEHMVRARWQFRGGWQAMRIVKESGSGAISSGDSVFIRGHTDECLQLKPGTEEVGALLSHECPAWQISQADGHPGPITSGDSIFLKQVDASKYLDIQGDQDGLARARWNLTGSWQTLVIEREDPDAIRAGDQVTLVAHTGALVDTEDKLVRARWPQAGPWRALVLEADENVGPWMQSFAITGGDGRAFYSGDEMNLWAASGRLVEVQSQVARARWDKKGAWQTFRIEKEGGGIIRRGDRIFLKAHTGKYLEVHGSVVEATGKAPSDVGTFLINYTGPNDRRVYKQCAVLAVLALGVIGILVYELCQPQTPPPKGGAPRLEALDAPRWIASIQIVLCHFYGYTWGAAWTQFFFVLSGFVLSYVEMARPVGKAPQMSQLRYVTHRMVTLYPTYVLTLVCAGIQWNHSALDWMTLPLHLLFVQAWFPITYKKLGYDEWQWSGVQWAQVSWFVSVLVIYWFMLRPLTRRIRRLSLRTCCAAIVALWAVSAMWWYLGDVLMRGTYGCRFTSQRCFVFFNDYFIYHGWLGMLHVFVSGIVMARIFILTSMKDAEVGGPVSAETQRLALDPDRAPFFFRFGACIGYLLFALLVLFVGKGGYHKDVTFYHNGGILPAMLLVLVGGALGVDPMARYLFQNRVFRMLGRISYPQYLIQCNVWGIVLHIYPKEGAMVSPQIVFPIALFVLSYVMERLVTRVGVEWLKPSKDKQRKSSVTRVVAWLESKLVFSAKHSETSAPVPPDTEAPCVPQGITLLQSKSGPRTERQADEKVTDLASNNVLADQPGAGAAVATVEPPAVSTLPSAARTGTDEMMNL